MRRAFIVLVAALFATGFIYWRATAGTGRADGSPVDVGPAASTVPPTDLPATAPRATAEIDPLRTAALAGVGPLYDPVVIGPCNLFPHAEQDVSSPIDGVLEDVVADLGQRVAAGELLARLD